MINVIRQQIVKNGPRLQMRAFLIALALLIAGGTLTGCGKKPGQVDPPVGSTAVFPRTYPDPSTDPPS